MERRDRRGRRIGYNWWRDFVVSSWFSMDQVWLARREEYAFGYKTEEREFAETNPRPTLKVVMVTNRFRHLEETE